MASILRSSPLCRFSPYTSVNSLRLAEGSTWPFEGVQPAFISLNGEELVVYSGAAPADPWNSTEVIRTNDPAEAARALIELLG